MKRGFTLVEMLVILIFLSLIFLFAVPSTINMLKKSEDDKYNLFLNDVYLATEAYIEKYKDDYPNLNIIGAKTYIYMKDLVDEGLISTNLVNPKYCVDDVCSPKKIAECTDKTCSVDDYTITVTKDEDGKYVYSFEQGLADECEYSVGQEFLFDYTGSVQTFTPKCSGNYKLEVWGAQGGDATCGSTGSKGGKGGYSVGIINSNADTPLYIVVGQKGITGSTASTVINGGYNGGGSAMGCDGQGIANGQYECQGSGGGATHIAISLISDGLLERYESNQDKLLIVAGAGGGSFDYYSYNSYLHYGTGGIGGGTTGGSPTNSYSGTNSTVLGTPGTQSPISGASLFGKAASSPDKCWAGGGSGFYGGGPSKVTGGAGGSGYLSSRLTESSMESGVNEGNGHAKITYLGE